MKSSYMIPVRLSDASSTDWAFTGIYKITNTTNGKCYIGQAVDIRARLMQHANNKHNHKVALYLAIDKYGLDQFESRVLTIINTFGKTQDEIKKELNALEVFYIELYDSYLNGYNMTPGGDSGRLGFKHTKETIEKIRKAHENYKPKRAYDVSKKVYGYDLLTKTVIEAESIAEASHKSGVDYRSIGQICNNDTYKQGGRFISMKRWLFSFQKDDLINRVNWFFSEERAELKKHPKYRKYGRL